MWKLFETKLDFVILFTRDCFFCKLELLHDWVLFKQRINTGGRCVQLRGQLFSNPIGKYKCSFCCQFFAYVGSLLAVFSTLVTSVSVGFSGTVAYISLL